MGKLSARFAWLVVACRYAGIFKNAHNLFSCVGPAKFNKSFATC